MTENVNINEELANEAQEAPGEIGAPMSLAAESALEQTAGNRPLAPTSSDIIDAEKDERQRQFWRNFIVWCFDAWPRFDSDETTERAAAELGFVGKPIGSSVLDCIQGDAETFAEMTEDQRAAYLEAFAMLSLLAEAKELVCQALGMDKAFASTLAARYADEADQWRWQHLKHVRESSQKS